MSNNTAYPTEIKLEDGRVLTTADCAPLRQFFDQVVTRATSVEKEKLYSNIERLTAEKVQKDGELVTVNAQLREALGITQQQHAREQQLRRELEQANQQTSLNPAAMKQMMAETFALLVPQAMADAIKPIREQQEAIRVRTFETYKAERLQQLGDSIIPELVGGNNEQEFEASVVRAQAARQRYAAAQPPAQQQSTAPAAQGAGLPPLPTSTLPPTAQPQGNGLPPLPGQQQPQQQRPAAPALPIAAVNLPAPMAFHSTPDMGGIPDIMSMGDEEFAANRESLLRQVKAMATDWEQQRATA